MNERDLGWLEGIIDGEGTITLHRQENAWFPMLIVPNTNRELVFRGTGRGT